MATTTRINKPTAQNKDATIIAGIQKNLATSKSITLSGTQYTTAQLIAVFQADSDAITATAAAHKALTQAALNERSTRQTTAVVRRALRNFLLAQFGEAAVTVLGDFGFTAPKSTATGKTAATKALAAAKGKATRTARNTMGSVQKLDVTGGLTQATLTDSGSGAILTPQQATGSSSTPAANAPAVAAQAPTVVTTAAATPLAVQNGAATTAPATVTAATPPKPAQS